MFQCILSSVLRHTVANPKPASSSKITHEVIEINDVLDESVVFSKGLNNSRNTCYINSVLMCMFYFVPENYKPVKQDIWYMRTMLPNNQLINNILENIPSVVLRSDDAKINQIRTELYGLKKGIQSRVYVDASIRTLNALWDEMFNANSSYYVRSTHMDTTLLMPHEMYGTGVTFTADKQEDAKYMMTLLTYIFTGTDCIVYKVERDMSNRCDIYTQYVTSADSIWNANTGTTVFRGSDVPNDIAVIENSGATVSYTWIYIPITTRMFWVSFPIYNNNKQVTKFPANISRHFKTSQNTNVTVTWKPSAYILYKRTPNKGGHYICACMHENDKWVIHNDGSIVLGSLDINQLGDYITQNGYNIFGALYVRYSSR